MPAKDKRVDAYITKSADFAKPILNHLRELVHRACPEAQETIKWSMPHFVHHGNMCHMAAFKTHCGFGIWKSALVFGPDKGGRMEEAMGNFGRITSLADLPPDKELIAYIKKAAELNVAGVKVPDKKPRNTTKTLEVPDYFMAAIRKNKKALAAFENYSYSHKKEYVQWVGEAKREETRAKRLAQTVEWLAEGKSRNWRYENC